MNPIAASWTLVLVIALSAAHALAQNPGEGDSPIAVDHGQRAGFVSFLNERHPGNRIGYRFFEHTPLEAGEVPKTEEEAGITADEVDALVREFEARPLAVVHRQGISGHDGWIDQHWEFHMAPASDGIDLLWVISTADVGLPSYYGVQQCFRMGGATNEEWRRAIAETPAFSEYDLWAAHEGRQEKTSLTYVLRAGEWEALPATEECVGAQTPLGVRADLERLGTERPAALGPYEAKLYDPADCGLATRTNPEGNWVCGLYWERTSHITDHHPADCLHAIVNIGNLPPHARRAIRGKIYWFEGSKNDLKQRWRSDFATPRTAARTTTHTFKRVDGLEIQADVFRADDDVIRPVVVWIHGGALIMGGRESVGGRLKSMLLDAGYAIVSIDYRLAPETKLPAIIEDVEDAFTWLAGVGAKELRVDKSRIVVAGGSAGGYLTLTSGFRATPRPVALVSLWGYGDLIGDWYSTPSPHARHHQVVMSSEEAWAEVDGPPIANARDRQGNGGAFYQHCRQHGTWPKAVSGWDPHAEAEKFHPYMPVKNVTADYPPTFLLHGTADTDVPFEQAEQMVGALKKHGVPYEFIPIPNGEHSLAGGDPALIDAAYDAMMKFIERYARP